MLKKRKSEEGASTFVLMLGVVGVSLVVFSLLAQRAQNELNLTLHRDIQGDKPAVLKAFEHLAACPSNPPACSVGDRLEIKNKPGKIMVNRDGSSRIGRWNVRVDCQAGGSQKYAVMISRMSPNGEVLADPLTKRPMKWEKLANLDDACTVQKPEETKLMAAICYGALDGKESLPPAEARDCGECQFKNKYCGDNQVPFPSCEAGFVPVFRYSDRYGWGGIDLTKYTLCRKKT